MKKISVATSDNKIWNQPLVYAEIAQAMLAHNGCEIDLLGEGPDLELLGLYDFLGSFNCPLNNVTIYTANLLENHNVINIVYNPPMHLLDLAKDYIADVPKHSNLKHFGMFIGRSNAQRLHLASYLDKHYLDKTLMSYHFNFHDDFHANNIGLEELIRQYGIADVRDESDFLHRCPIRFKQDRPVVINKNLSLNPAQQLFQNDKHYFSQTYQDFFIELVCESYFTGQTFFPTEKIFRPILLKTPFIVQGSQYFLHNLRALGFKTFSQWWDEGYAEDPDGQQLVEIKQVLDTLAEKSQSELQIIYAEMQPVLEHNYATALALKDADFRKLVNEAN